jgi:hypothetical protein
METPTALFRIWLAPNGEFTDPANADDCKTGDHADWAATKFHATEQSDQNYLTITLC